MPANYTIEGTIGTELELCSLPGLWLRSTYQEDGWLFSGGTREGEELSLKTVWEELVPGIALPFEMDMQLADVEVSFSIAKQHEGGQRDYKLHFAAAVKLSANPSGEFESHLNFREISFTYNKVNGDDAQTYIELHLKGDTAIGDALIIPDFSLDLTYKYQQEKQTTDWLIKGALYILAFQRLMAFKAEAGALEKTQHVNFSFNSADPALHAAYLRHIEGVTADDVLKLLNGGQAPSEQSIPLSALPGDIAPLLGDGYNATQKEAILAVVAQARNSGGPLITIPDILNENKPLCIISPNKFEIKLVREDGKFKSFDFAIGSSLTLYNTWNNQSEIFSIKDGILTSGYNNSTKDFYLTYNSSQTDIAPLNAIAALPGIMDSLLLAFGETVEDHPKTSAFTTMLRIHPLGFSFHKQQDGWDISGGIRMVLNDGLRIVDEHLYSFVENLFPKTGEERYLEGRLAYSSKNGLLFTLENNNGLEIPNFFEIIGKSLNTQFIADFKAKTDIDLVQSFDLGTSFIILDRVELKIAAEISLDLRIGVGLPSNLNNRLFNPTAKIHGLIKTYDREKFINAASKRSTTKEGEEMPDDNLLRFSLRIGTEGVSGKLDRFNLLNMEKINDEFAGVLTEGVDSITLDMNGLTQNGKNYGKLKIDKFVFDLDFKTGAFKFSGGIQLLSDTLRIPVKPFFKKLIAILPTDKFNTTAMNGLADTFIDSVELKSMDFYNPQTDTLSIDPMLDFFKQFLLEEHRHLDILPADFVRLINENATAVSRLLPKMLLEYLSIKIPAGVRFALEITADQSVSFALEVPEPTPEQKAAGYTDYLQVLMPDPLLNVKIIRLKKIGIGSGLFNQAIRLDLSGEMAVIDEIDLVAGIPLALLRNNNPEDARLLHMVPDARSFGYRYTLDNLLMLIFPQTIVPIPVPVFYDKIAVYAAGISGAKAEAEIKFPRPKVNIVALFKKLGELRSFFNDADAVLPVSNYGVARTREDAPQDDALLPAFSAGPIYVELPGILGYQKMPDNTRQHIQIGFKDIRTLNAQDLFAVVGNSVKFALRTAIEKKRYPIRVDDARSEYPLNYMVKFLPESQRIGAANIVLFDVLEANFAWALSTPGEFKEKVLPLLQQAQQQTAPAGERGNWAAAEILALIPGSDQWSNDDEGVIVCLKGGVKISDSFIIDAVTATAITTNKGFASGIALRSSLANVFDLELSGGIMVDAQSADNKFGLKGNASLHIMGRIPVMKGSFSMGVGNGSHFMVTGMLDLFPDALFNGVPSPIQLYTGTAEGVKSSVTGIINQNGIILGSINADGTVGPAGIYLKIGSFSLSGSTRLVSTADVHEWDLQLSCYDAILRLGSQSRKTDEGNELEFSFSGNRALSIGHLLSLSNNDGSSGPSGKLVLLYRGESLAPELKECHFNGRFYFIGFSCEAVINIEQNRFFADIAADLGILSASFRLSGDSFSNASSFNLIGNISLLGGLARLDVTTAYITDAGSSSFTGSGVLTFMGSKTMQLDINAGVENGAPRISATGALNISLLGGFMELYSGTLSQRSKIVGSINNDEGRFTGELAFKFGILQAAGSMNMIMDRGNGVKINGTISFSAGFLIGCNASVAITKRDNIFEMAGMANANLTLIPGILELNANSSITVQVDELHNHLDLFELKGTTSLMGVNSDYTLQINQDNLRFRSFAALPLVDLSFIATSNNFSDVRNWIFSGNIDITKLNSGIDAFYNAIGIRSKASEKLSGVENNRNDIANAANSMNNMHYMLNYIREVDNYFSGNTNDPDGFYCCVPPVYHIAYWSESRWYENWGYPRYSKEEVDRVILFWDYKRQLNMPMNEPQRHDVGRLINTIVTDINNKLYEIGRALSDQFRGIVNSIHHLLSDEILKYLNIDTTNIDELNNIFNQSMTQLDNVAREWRDFNDRLLHNKPLEIFEISYDNVSVDMLTQKRFFATVRYSILGIHNATQIEFNLDDPIGSITRNLKAFMPQQLQILIP